MNNNNLPSNSVGQPSSPTSLLDRAATAIELTVQSHGNQYYELFQHYRSHTPPATTRKAAASTSPAIVTIAARFSREAALLLLRYHIAETFDFIGITDTVTKRQIVQTAELILDHELYRHLNLDEFLLFLRRFKQGDYGKIYQSARPNPQEFIQCLRPFWDELVEHRIRIAREEEERRQRRQLEADKEECMTRAEYEEIKTLTRMYEMQIPQKVTH